jgi:hypothetical protein
MTRCCPPAEATTSGTHFLGDLGRPGSCSGLPNGAPRSIARVAASAPASPELLSRLGIRRQRAHRPGSDDNRDNRRNNDNERSDGFGIDQVLLRWRASDHASLQFGKGTAASICRRCCGSRFAPGRRRLPFDSAGRFRSLRTWPRGYFAGQHLYGDESRIAAAQVASNWREGAPTRGGITVSWLDFSDLGELRAQGLARTNGGRTVVTSDYCLLDLQLAGHTELGNWPTTCIWICAQPGADLARRSPPEFSVMTIDNPAACSSVRDPIR